MKKSDFLTKLAASLNKNKTIAASTLINNSPNMATMISKLIMPKNQSLQSLYSTKNITNTLNTNKLTSMSGIIADRYADNKNILSLFPDLELAMQILVSSILSPKDMTKVELIYRTNETVFPIEVNSQILEAVKKYLNTNYKLNDTLPKILENTLFLKGSYIKAILPESLIDDVINNKITLSTESLNGLDSKSKNITSLGILGPFSDKAKLSLESYKTNISKEDYTEKGLYINPQSPKLIDDKIEISDNFQFLKLPLALRKTRSKAITSRYTTNIATEAKPTVDLDNYLFKTVNTNVTAVKILPDKDNLSRKSVGKPLVLNLPSESVIPVSLPNEPEKHLGYFIVLDENGNPVTGILNMANRMQSIFGTGANQSDLTSYLTQKSKDNLLGSDLKDNAHMDNVVQIYAALVEANLKQRLKNGLYNEEVTIANNEEIYKIMLARSLSNSYTKIIYIPEEFIMYFAFDYYDNGVGKSLLDNLRIICGIRAMLMFARVMAHLKSSINITHVGLTLDEHDPDPQKTVEVAIAEVLKLRQQYFPLGINSPTDLVDWIQRAGIEFSFEGHPGLPNTKFDFDIKNLQHTIPPSEFEDELRKQTYMALGLSPETVDNGFNSEFATTVVSNNILLSKRVLVYQAQFTSMLISYIRKLLMFDEEFKAELRELIKADIGKLNNYLTDEDKELQKTNQEALIDVLLNRFIDTLEVDLPKPDETTIDTQLSSFDKYNEAIDKVLDNWISTELTNESLTGNISGYMDSIKPIVKAYFIRRWMSENNFMPELAELVTLDNEGKPNIDLYDISKAHITNLMKSAFKLISSMQGNKQVMDKNLETIGAEEPPEQSSESESEESSNEGSDNFEDFGNEGEEELGSEEPETKKEEKEEKPEKEEEPKEDKETKEE
jgi:hypothetical protein